MHIGMVRARVIHLVRHGMMIARLSAVHLAESAIMIGAEATGDGKTCSRALHDHSQSRAENESSQQACPEQFAQGIHFSRLPLSQISAFPVSVNRG
jgi:hypothetical protein